MQFKQSLLAAVTFAVIAASAPLGNVGECGTIALPDPTAPVTGVPVPAPTGVASSVLGGDWPVSATASASVGGWPHPTGSPSDGLPVGGLPVGGLPVGGLPVGGLPVGGLPVGGLPVGGVPVGGDPVDGLPLDGLPGLGAVLTGSLPVIGEPISGLPLDDLPIPDKGNPTAWGPGPEPTAPVSAPTDGSAGAGVSVTASVPLSGAGVPTSLPVSVSTKLPASATLPTVSGPVPTQAQPSGSHPGSPKSPVNGGSSDSGSHGSGSSNGHGNNGGDYAGQCNTGPVQCCNTVQSADSADVQKFAGLLGVVIEDLTTQVGVTCSPISVLGVGENSCSAHTVCCENNSYGGVLNIGCVPIIL